MMNKSVSKSPSGGGNRKPQLDLTGREQLVGNVLFNWGAYSVFIGAGFIMPRMIDAHLGRELLGVWDFAWSLVSYFELVQAGIGASVNRYIARYRIARDAVSINRVVISASCVLAVAGAIVMALTVAASLLLPWLFGDRLGENTLEAQWVVVFLGASLAVRVSCSAFSGILTGCHRWELHNINTSCFYAATVAGAVVALLLGGGLRVVAAIVLVGQVLTELGRIVLAHRACEGLRFRPSLVGWSTVCELLVFGGKTLIPHISKLLLNQTTSILIVLYLGPWALALYARPRSLVHHMTTLVNKMAMVLMPTTSSLQSVGDVKGIRHLLVSSVSYAVYLVFPMILLLVVCGGQILRLWMGPDYADGLVPAVLALGSFSTLIHIPVLTTLAGMNAHGRAGASQFVASVCSVALTFVALALFRWGTLGAAVAVTLPLTIVNLVYLPLFVCRQTGLGLRRYFLSAVAKPMLRVAPFGACLVGARLMFPAKPLVSLVSGAATGGAILSVLYWRYVLPDKLRAKIAAPLRANWVLKLRSNIGKSIITVAVWTGVVRLLRFLRRNRIGILMVHGVMDDGDRFSSWVPAKPRLLSAELDNCLRLLSKRYQFISLLDAVDMLEGRKPMRPYCLVMTFDDGYRNNLTHALPILRRHGVPATFFVPSGFLDHPRPFWSDRLDYVLQHAQVDGRKIRVGSVERRLDGRSREALSVSFERFRRAAKRQRMSDKEFQREMERLAAQLESECGVSLSAIQQNDDVSAIMTWEQIEACNGDEDIIIGSHTVDHVRLGKVDADTARDQLVASKQDIERHIGKPCTCLAYPDGSYREETIELAREAGYRCCVTTKEGLNRPGCDCLLLKRMHVPLSACDSEVLAIVCGLSGFLFRVKMVLWRLQSHG